jgi:hypothetical protein
LRGEQFEQWTIRQSAYYCLGSDITDTHQRYPVVLPIVKLQPNQGDDMRKSDLPPDTPETGVDNATRRTIIATGLVLGATALVQPLGGVTHAQPAEDKKKDDKKKDIKKKDAKKKDIKKKEIKNEDDK